jgi:NADP-dependent 3-hydroxy acid dehydrogenase YdfG
MIASATAFLGGIDALVNNAGVAAISLFEGLTPETWKDMIDTNLTGVFNCCHAALPELQKSDHANIINIGSRAGRYAFAGGTAYNTTKFGLQGFSEALFLDLNKYGISVSLIAPGTVATGLADVEDQLWHLQPEDVATVIGDVLRHHKRVNLNWIEMRSSIPR